MIRKLMYALSVAAMLAVMALIFGFSAQERDVSNNVSRGVTAFIVDILPMTANHTPEQKRQDITELNNYIRKCAHFTIYAALGFCASAVFYFSKRFKRRKLIYFFAAALCCIYAVTDEIHQGFVAGRGPLVKDVVIDTCGSTVGGGLFALLYAVLYKRDILPPDLF